METIYWRRLERIHQRQANHESRLASVEAAISSRASSRGGSEVDTLSRIAKLIGLVATLARLLALASPYLLGLWLLIWAVMRPILLWLLELARSLLL